MKLPKSMPTNPKAFKTEFVMKNIGLFCLAGSIVFAAIVAALIFRYEYDQYLNWRVDNWTGTVECHLRSTGEWVSTGSGYC